MKVALVLVLTFLACRSGDDKSMPRTKADSTRPVMDSVTPVVREVPIDHAALINDIRAKLSSGMPFGKSSFDTTINEYNGRITYELGQLFSKNRVHAVVNVHDGDSNPIYVFSRDNNAWKFIHQLNEVYNPGDYPVVFRDMNFDGYKDLLIKWFYMAGRCNCDGEGCLNVYLYNPLTNSLVENKDIPGYLDMHLVEAERAIYLGEHCQGVYRKFRWNNMEMVLVESYEFTPAECFQTGEGPCSLVHRVHRNGMIFEDTIQNKELPDRWINIFHAD